MARDEEAFGGLDSVADQYRTAAGLGERKDDEPADPAQRDDAELNQYTEPEGGYGNPDVDRDDEKEAQD